MAGKLKIYTRTGDKGETSLFGGTRVLKSSSRVETYGTIDELNSTIGAAVSQVKTTDKALKSELERVQHDLFAIGSNLASPGAEAIPYLQDRIDEFEIVIDQLTAKLPELKNFILPGGGKAGSLLHMARTICRRAERRLVYLAQSEDVDRTLIKYVNRLSDLLFTMARFVNHQEKKKETIWSKR